MWINWLDHVLPQEHHGVMAGNSGECMLDHRAWHSNISCCFIDPASKQASPEVPLKAPPENAYEVRFLLNVSMLSDYTYNL